VNVETGETKMDGYMTDTADNDDDFLGDDEWEDIAQLRHITSNYPSDWKVVKVSDFNSETMVDMKEWCSAMCVHKYDHIGWDSGCSYTVGVIFESISDAVIFRLTWGN
jgi:hypothetical protein